MPVWGTAGRVRRRVCKRQLRPCTAARAPHTRGAALCLCTGASGGVGLGGLGIEVLIVLVGHLREVVHLGQAREAGARARLRMRECESKSASFAHAPRLVVAWGCAVLSGPLAVRLALSNSRSTRLCLSSRFSYRCSKALAASSNCLSLGSELRSRLASLSSSLGLSLGTEMSRERRGGVTSAVC